MAHHIDQLAGKCAVSKIFDATLAVTGNMRALCLITFCILLVGCASTPRLSSDDRAHLGVVRIDPTIDTPTQMHYLGPGSGIGFMFGAVGAAITAAANLSPGEQLNKFAQDNGIHIDQIVREEATEAFQQSGKLDLTELQDANAATLKISISMYGFSISSGFSSKLVPVINIKCVLIGRDGKTIWSASDSVLTLGNPAEGKTPDEFNANPKLIGDAWRTAVKAVMADITSHM